ncbi:hypothetical protein Agabi119p4_11744 [Agaricus bisporus var. burnettii]|uniref:F-box domain-containing protein n=1 Tax=Agaricus bisporus var. burnettii TaxID=192524 RepID=A0A8H7BX01_AGABI|nr:hypothetical protein Agabi119p4_11744 [Agaricus bisporus var. burnettii]
MESTEPFQHCDYLLQDDSPHIVAARLMDLAQVNDQINRVNDHIREVYKIRSVFLHRSNQIRSPATTIPIEVLSAIFCHLVDPELMPDEPTTSSPICLHQSFILSSVSSHWRQAAFATPELWTNIQSRVHKHTHVAKSVISALQHCSTYARTLNISLSLPHWCHTKVLDRLTKSFFSPEVKAKVIKLRLYKAPPQWLRLISQLRVPSISDF